MDQPRFDAFLFQSFGGPNRIEDVLPFLENVTRGRNIPRERLEEVAKHYYLFNGKSPINEINLDIIGRLKTAFRDHKIDLPIYFGNRNFEPFISQALTQMKLDGRRHAIAFVTSAYGSFSSCRQYKLDVAEAQAKLGDGAPEVVKIRHYYSHNGFIGPMVHNSLTALKELPSDEEVELIFTAHSIPLSMSDGSPYLPQLKQSMQLVSAGIEKSLKRKLRSALVFQSRSGPPTQPWLEPDISDYLRTIAQRGTKNAVMIPIGFISDHLEVIYDLDIVATNTAKELGISVVRAKTASDSSEFIEMIVDLTKEILTGGTAPTETGHKARIYTCSETCCGLSGR